jgi:hypothetical protein
MWIVTVWKYQEIKSLIYNIEKHWKGGYLLICFVIVFLMPLSATLWHILESLLNIELERNSGIISDTLPELPYTDWRIQN